VDFASDFVAREVVEQMKDDDRLALQRELAACREVKEKASFSGHAHEAVFHTLMRKGGSFECKALDAPGQPTFLVSFDGCKRMHLFRDEQDVCTVKDADYFIPVSQNCPAVD
jgi:hypothetical protein